MARTKDQIPRLRVIDGYAQASAKSGRLMVAADRGPGPQVQLGLPGFAPPRTALICATISSLVDAGVGIEGPPRDIRNWLCTHGVRKIVDVRVAPSYRGLGLRHRAFVELAGELGATYVHLVDLSNRFVGESWHAERYRQRVERHFEDKRELVEQLRRMVDDGPLLLIVAERSTLERELLLRALERVSPDFETQVLTGGV